ncbi:MAG: hypothetical protein LKJ90_08955 [Faecalibacterium sp.]|nr:hypothetical protein [Faecalibacterium sp.]
MKNINRYFDIEQLDLLKRIGIVFKPDHDYTDDELLNIEDIITNSYTDNGFAHDSSGGITSEPKQPICQQYESIIDIFFDILNM